MIKRLVDSVIHGFGFSAGAALFDETAKEVGEALREPTPEEKKKAEAEARKRAVALEKERVKAAKEAEKKREKEAAEIDDELAALKRKMGK